MSVIRPNPKPLPRRPRAPKPIAKPKRSWAYQGSAGSGVCAYCGKWKKLTWDHVLPRSIYFGADRDTQLNLARVCLECNIARTRGFRPRWTALPLDTRHFIIDRIGATRAARYFDGVPEAA